MKKHITTNVNQNTVDSRRSTRNTTVNKLSKSRKRPKVVNDDVINNEIEVFGLQTRLTSTIDLAAPIKEISPLKKQLSIIQESPSPCQLSSSAFANVNENDTTKGNLVTPKNNKTHSFIESTPFKEDLLACSQHFDPQSDVAWDCRSPDAINFLKRGRRRRHYSDVSDIVTQLQVCTEELQNEPPDSTPSPLLGLWMNDDNCWKLPEQKPHRERRRKERSKSKAKVDNGNETLSLLEKLQLAMEKCDDTCSNEDTKGIEDDKRSVSVGDESKDLFDDRNKAEDSWSDDDLFEDDSFIIKATQVENVLTCNKRKLDQHTPDEPPVKSVKYCETKKTVKCTVPSLSTARFTCLNSKPSPFKKHRSFNDRHEYEKSQERNNNFKVQYNTRQSVDKQSNTCLSRHKQSNTCISVHKQSNGNTSQQYHSRSTIQSAVSSKPNTLIGSKQCVLPSTKPYNNTVSKPTCSTITTSKSNSLHVSKPNGVPSCKRSNVEISKQYKISASKQIETPSPILCTSNNAKNCAISSSNQTVCTTPSCTSVAVRQSFVNTKATYTTSFSKPYMTSSSKQSANNTEQTCTNISATTSKKIMTNQCISKTVYDPKRINSVKTNNCVNEKKDMEPSSELKPSGSRRTSASFDTSLSDDILCQLVEPDEILDSQIPVCTNTKSTSHIDDALSFFHEEPKSKVKQSDFYKDSIKTENGNDNLCLKRSLDKNTKTMVRPSVNQSKYGANSPGLHSQQNCHNSSKGFQTNNQKIFDKQKTPSSLENKVHDILKPGVLIKQEVGIMGNQFNETNASDNRQSDTNSNVNTRLFSKGCRTNVKKEQNIDSQRSINVEKQKSEKTYSFKSKIPRNGTSVVSATKTETEVNGYAMENTSEDLFMSDDDGLSEPQLLALLDTVESTATNVVKKFSTISPLKCLQEEIENKKQEAYKRLQQRTSNHILSNSSSQLCNASPFKCTPETQTNLQSPFKCSPEDIENKKQEAYKRLQQRTSNHILSNNSSQFCHASPFKCSPETQPNLQSPFKCSPEDIEQKRLEAIKLKQQKAMPVGKKKQSGISQCHIDTSSLKGRLEIPTKSQIESSPFKCSPEDIVKKRQEAVEQKQQKSLTIDNDIKQPHNDANLLKSSPDKRKDNRALNCKKQNFDKATCIKDIPKATSFQRTVNRGTEKSQPQQFLEESSSIGVLNSDKLSPKKKTPCKYSQAEIEQKKQAAMQRRLEKMKVAKHLKY